MKRFLNSVLLTLVGLTLSVFVNAQTYRTVEYKIWDGTDNKDYDRASAVLYGYLPLNSCGKAVIHNEIKIDSADPENIPGEILVKGMNVMLGYYKNEEATRQTLDKEGWYHTGDLGVMDAEGNVFIKGRSKYMLLGANGQNIYPEEIEDKLNSMALVNESIVIQEGDKLVGLVYPDIDEAHNMGFSNDDLVSIMEQNRKELNNALPAYSKLTSIRIHNEEFEKTPKKSIKRFLYLK